MEQIRSKLKIIVDELDAETEEGIETIDLDLEKIRDLIEQLGVIEYDLYLKLERGKK